MEPKQIEEKDLFTLHLNISLKATILQKKTCPHFSTFYEEPKEKYPRCLVDEYPLQTERQTLTQREAKKICHFFDPKTIETKCIFFTNYYQTEEDLENEVIEDGQRRYVKEIGDLLKVKLEPELKAVEEDKEKKYEYRHLKTLAKRIIQMQIDLLIKHLGMPPEPPSKYTTELENEDSFKKWMERTYKKITKPPKI